jgi:hypothetical protein
MRMRANDRGSIPMALLVVLVGASFGALLLPMLLTQMSSTRFEVSRVHSLNAAQAGIDVALGMVRSATTIDLSRPDAPGDPAKLPCNPVTKPIVGTANQLGGGVGSGAYTATIAYYAVGNPAAHSDDPTWLNNDMMQCVDGYGTYDGTLNTVVPSFALITSTGTDGPSGNGVSPGRTLQTTYVFSTTNANFRGDIIPFVTGMRNNVPLCLDAGSSPWANGTQPTLQTCPAAAPLGSPPTLVPASQSWFWRTDNTIQLVQSVGTSHPNGVCLTTPGNYWIGTSITISDCGPLGTPDPHQIWGNDYNRRIQGGLDSCVTPMGRWPGFWGLPTGSYPPDVGSILQPQPCALFLLPDYQKTDPKPNVGYGGAGFSTNQLAVGGVFSQCLDLPGVLLGFLPGVLPALGVLPLAPGGNNFLSVNPCKSGTGFTTALWTQQFTPDNPPTDLPAKGKYVLQFPFGLRFFLTSTGQEGSYVTDSFHDCSETPQIFCTTGTILPDQVQWTYYGTKDATGKTLPYSDRYTLHDFHNNCLAPGAPYINSFTSYTTVVSAKCDGTTSQKWNGDPNLVLNKVENTVELPFTASAAPFTVPAGP